MDSIDCLDGHLFFPAPCSASEGLAGMRLFLLTACYYLVLFQTDFQGSYNRLLSCGCPLPSFFGRLDEAYFAGRNVDGLCPSFALPFTLVFTGPFFGSNCVPKQFFKKISNFSDSSCGLGFYRVAALSIYSRISMVSVIGHTMGASSLTSNIPMAWIVGCFFFSGSV